MMTLAIASANAPSVTRAQLQVDVCASREGGDPRIDHYQLVPLSKRLNNPSHMSVFDAAGLLDHIIMQADSPLSGAAGAP